MNATAIADVIRRVAETQAENFRAALRDVQKSLDARISSVVKSYADDVAERDRQIESLTQALGARDESIEALKSAQAELVRDMEASVATLKDAHSESFGALRSEFEAEIKALSGLLEESQDSRNQSEKDLRSDLKVCREENAALKAQLEECQKSFDASVSEQSSKIESADGAIKSLCEKVESVQNAAVAEFHRVESEFKSAAELAMKRLEALDERSKGFMHFRGLWDESSEYAQGATVACKNAVWVALRDNPGTPGDTDSGWQMCIKTPKSGRLVTPYDAR